MLQHCVSRWNVYILIILNFVCAWLIIYSKYAAVLPVNVEYSFISRGKKYIPHICTSAHPIYPPNRGIVTCLRARGDGGGNTVVGYLPTCRCYEIFRKCSFTVTRRISSIQIQAANWVDTTRLRIFNQVVSPSCVIQGKKYRLEFSCIHVCSVLMAQGLPCSFYSLSIHIWHLRMSLLLTAVDVYFWITIQILCLIRIFVLRIASLV